MPSRLDDEPTPSSDALQPIALAALLGIGRPDVSSTGSSTGAGAHDTPGSIQQRLDTLLTRAWLRRDRTPTPPHGLSPTTTPSTRPDAPAPGATQDPGDPGAVGAPPSTLQLLAELLTHPDLHPDAAARFADAYRPAFTVFIHDHPRAGSPSTPAHRRHQPSATRTHQHLDELNSHLQRRGCSTAPTRIPTLAAPPLTTLGSATARMPLTGKQLPHLLDVLAENPSLATGLTLMPREAHTLPTILAASHREPGLSGAGLHEAMCAVQVTSLRCHTGVLDAFTAITVLERLRHCQEVLHPLTHHLTQARPLAAYFAACERLIAAHPMWQVARHRLLDGFARGRHAGPPGPGPETARSYRPVATPQDLARITATNPDHLRLREGTVEQWHAMGEVRRHNTWAWTHTHPRDTTYPYVCDTASPPPHLGEDGGQSTCGPCQPTATLHVSALLSQHALATFTGEQAALEAAGNLTHTEYHRAAELATRLGISYHDASQALHATGMA